MSAGGKFRLRVAAVVIVVAGFAAAAGVAFAQAVPPAVTPEALALAAIAFTSQQSAAGRGLYGNSCAGCHGQELQGLDASPPLIGATFSRWAATPVSALYEFILARMPLDSPGSLQPRQALGLTAFLLERNGFVAGDVPLPEDPAAMALIGLRQ